MNKTKFRIGQRVRFRIKHLSLIGDITGIDSKGRYKIKDGSCARGCFEEEKMQTQFYRMLG